MSSTHNLAAAFWQHTGDAQTPANDCRIVTRDPNTGNLNDGIQRLPSSTDVPHDEAAKLDARAPMKAATIPPGDRLMCAIAKTASQVGGSDQVAYDGHLNRFYTASRNMTKSGISRNGALTPVLGVIDAHTLTWIGNIPTSINSHSVAADSTTGHVFVPIAATATTAGGIKVFGPVGSP